MKAAAAVFGTVLASCVPPPAPSSGPASLGIVPPAYYSARPPQRQPIAPQRHHAPVQGAARNERETAPQTPEPKVQPEQGEQIEEINQRLDAMNRRLQQLRRSISRPANPPPDREQKPAE